MVGSEDPDQTALGTVLGQSDEGLKCLFLKHILNAHKYKNVKNSGFFQAQISLP